MEENHGTEENHRKMEENHGTIEKNHRTSEENNGKIEENHEKIEENHGQTNEKNGKLIKPIEKKSETSEHCEWEILTTKCSIWEILIAETKERNLDDPKKMPKKSLPT